MDTNPLSDQNPNATLLSRRDIQPDDQGNMSSAPGYGIEESKEEDPKEEIAIYIKSSKSTSSSQYGRYGNESAFLQTTRTGYDLMIQLMSDMGVTMDVSLKYSLKVSTVYSSRNHRLLDYPLC